LIDNGCFVVATSVAVGSEAIKVATTEIILSSSANFMDGGSLQTVQDFVGEWR
jgi:hypothetical protein